MHPIEEARKAAGLSRPKMSKLMGIPVRTIEEWEYGNRKCPSYVERLVIKELREIKESE
ncbi:MAG: helix-turn-helix domain-containing protein [Lentihominibacter sp.]